MLQNDFVYYADGMKKAILFLMLILLPVAAYEVYSPESFRYKNSEPNLLFVVDFSNSMSERLENEPKFNLVKKVLNRVLPEISPDTKVGMRVYGHNCNLLAFQACRSSELIVPLELNSTGKIQSAISKLRPRGMTPITYSLKQAVKKDFEQTEGQKHIILLTDGGENCDESPCDYAISLVKSRRDINIDVIAFDVEDSDDLEQLKCTADVTGGQFVEAKTNAQLVQSLENLILPHKQVEALLWGKNQ